MAALVAAILDGYGVKKGFPEPAILRFLFIRRRKGQGIGLHDTGAAAAVTVSYTHLTLPTSGWV